MSLKDPSKRAAPRASTNTYWAIAASSLAGLVITLVMSGFPISVGAFWPFSVSQAQNDEVGAPHNSSMKLLAAANNPDPRAGQGSIDIASTEGSALVADSGPSGTLPASVVTPGSAAITTYEVREGDSLSEIADMFGVSMNTILWANDIKDAKLISPGDTLLILPISGLQHKVAKGETLAGIAKKYDADLDEVALFNGLSPEAALASGETLIIPGGDLAPKTVAKKSSSSSSAKSNVKKAASSIPLGDWTNPVPGAYVSQGVHGYNGIDLAGIPSGTPVYAALGGSVIVAKSDGGYNGGYGNYVVIKHANGTQTLYAHLSSVTVSVGDAVGKGEHIGGVGNTGRSTGNHLHFEVRGAKNPFAN